MGSLPPLPIDPFEDPRFTALDEYPGGDEAHERDYEAACEEYERISHLHALAGRFGKHRQYYAHRKEVNRALIGLEEEAGHDGRTLALWLVLDHGFPWRDECELEDLQRILAFLADPKNREEACSMPPACPRRMPAPTTRRESTGEG
jgi:hypothetical protein